jgi:hypothetical protein
VTERSELTLEQRALRARAGTLGAYVQHATHDVRETTKAAREAFNDRFLNLVDPKRELPEPERLRRAAAARRAYFQRLSMKGLASRRARAKRRASAVADESTTS